jgi:hypothetical protein
MYMAALGAAGTLCTDNLRCEASHGYKRRADIMHMHGMHIQDLVVRDPADKPFFGNLLFGSSETNPKYPQQDDFNNVERVVIPAPIRGGQYVVRVTAPNIVTTSQEFSLVVTGTAFAQASNCSWPSCASDCSGHGSCVSGACVCDATYFGPDCSARMPRVRNSVGLSISVSSSRWSFYAFYVDTAVTSWSLSFTGALCSRPCH